MKVRTQAAPLPSIDPDTLVAGLNPEQTEVVLSGEGAIQVLAGAGAGKTKALVHRVAHLIAGYAVNPKSILAVTFSKKAADEMNSRLRRLGVVDCRIGTWHSLAWEILREERPEFTTWEVDDRDRFRTLLKIVLGYQGMDWKTADLTGTLSFIGLCKASCAEPGTEAAMAVAREIFERTPCGQNNPQLLCEAYARVTEAQEQRRLVTFDDMLLWTWRLLRDDSSARERWSKRFDFLLQDEAQDCNLVQAEIAELLARRHGNYMIVGDPAQSIYGFRGAKPQKFMDFVNEWAPVKVIRMFRNYRSGVEVITAANRVARAMAEGTSLGVDMAAERGVPADVKTAEYDTMDEEGQEVAREIMEAHESGVAWKDCAVLYRTNAQSRGVEEALLANRVPYVVIGGTNFYDRKEVKDLLAYLRLADGRGSDDEFRRSINSPFRYLGKAFVERCMDEFGGEGDTWTETVRRVAARGGIQGRQRTSALEWCGLIDSIAESIRLRDAMQGQVEAPGPETPQERDMIPRSPTQEVRPHMPAALLERVVAETSYTQYLTRDEGAETVENNRVSNVRELVRAAERFTTVRELLDYVDRTIAAAKAAKEGKHADRVTLCSLHRSKGLEWPFVAVIGVNEKILPHGRATDIEEERRLFYVGVTRSMDILRVSWVRQAAYGAKVVPLEPSRFLAEAELPVPRGATVNPTTDLAAAMDSEVEA